MTEEEKLGVGPFERRERVACRAVVDVQEARHEARAPPFGDQLVVAERIACNQNSSRLKQKRAVTGSVSGGMDDAGPAGDIEHLAA